MFAHVSFDRPHGGNLGQIHKGKVEHRPVAPPGTSEAPAATAPELKVFLLLFLQKKKNPVIPSD
jgi:hypothetical protein